MTDVVYCEGCWSPPDYQCQYQYQYETSMPLYDLKFCLNLRSKLDLFPIDGDLNYKRINSYIYVFYSLFSVAISLSLTLFVTLNRSDFWAPKFGNVMDAYFMIWAAIVFYFVAVILPVVDCCKIKSIFDVISEAYLINSKFKLTISNRLTRFQRLKILLVSFFLSVTLVFYVYLMLPGYPGEFVDQIFKYFISLRLCFCFEIIAVLNRVQLFFVRRVGVGETDASTVRNMTHISVLNGGVRRALGLQCLLLLSSYTAFLIVMLYTVLMRVFDGIAFNSLALTLVSAFSLCQFMFMLGKQSSELKTKV